MIKRIGVLAMALALCLVGTCFAGTPSGDLSGFVSAYEAQVNPNTIWGSLIPVVGILVTAMLFAFVWGRIRKTSGGLANKGKFKM